ncbi:MAG TPA: 3-methyl-2-oxobutanoate hydroxymethyltransferase [Stellaceae bacterium]|nr:3-methyl-2-oxobutanoate hydroxymethyltransferase [Stellaceae bacterium]
MSVAAPDSKKRTPAELARRKGGEPIVALTAYSAAMARTLDPIADLLLVGDSLGMVVYGFDSTLPVTLEMMIAHGAAAVRGATRACVIVDMPFGTYQESPAQAFKNAARIMAETGCAGIKIEGGEAMADTVRFLVERGIPVLGHIGLQPQSVNVIGGFRAQGRNEAEADRVMADARAIAKAGAFAIVIEGTNEPVARRVTEAIHVPTIGIGASPACDGQILVTEDLVGLSDGHKPRFVKRYAELNPAIAAAAAAYAEDVRTRAFPGPEHCYGPSTIERSPKPTASQRR